MKYFLSLDCWALFFKRCLAAFATLFASDGKSTTLAVNDSTPGPSRPIGGPDGDINGLLPTDDDGSFIL